MTSANVRSPWVNNPEVGSQRPGFWDCVTRLRDHRSEAHSRIWEYSRLCPPPEEVAVAVGIRIKFVGVNQEQFDRINKHVDPGSNPPKGILFHASGPIDDGWGVIDFWESRQDFDAFQGRIQEAVAAAGVEMQGAPDVKEFPVHETFRP
jgi:hypothetical protein